MVQLCSPHLNYAKIQPQRLTCNNCNMSTKRDHFKRNVDFSGDMLVFWGDALENNLPFQGDSQQKQAEVVVNFNQWLVHGILGIFSKVIPFHFHFVLLKDS